MCWRSKPSAAPRLPDDIEPQRVFLCAYLTILQCLVMNVCYIARTWRNWMVRCQPFVWNLIDHFKWFNTRLERYLVWTNSAMQYTLSAKSVHDCDQNSGFHSRVGKECAWLWSKLYLWPL
jgi:hypothetical protein